MFDRDYGVLLQRAAALEEFGGYLDTAEEKAFAQAQTAYTKERDRIVYQVLVQKPDIGEVTEHITGDLDSIAEQEPGWAGTIAFVKQDLIEKLTEEAGRNPAMRKITRYGSAALLGAMTIAYFGYWWANDLDVDQPLETQAGIMQRAEAYQKTRIYNDWADTRSRRGGFFKMILLKPIEPDDGEFAAANEFVSLTLGGAERMAAAELACGSESLIASEIPSETTLAFLDEVAEYLLDPQTQWSVPAPFTVLDPIAGRFPCQPLQDPAVVVD